MPKCDDFQKGQTATYVTTITNYCHPFIWCQERKIRSYQASACDCWHLGMSCSVFLLIISNYFPWSCSIFKNEGKRIEECQPVQNYSKLTFCPHFNLYWKKDWLSSSQPLKRPSSWNSVLSELCPAYHWLYDLFIHFLQQLDRVSLWWILYIEIIKGEGS